MKSDDSERVFEAVTMVVDAVSSIDACESKTLRNNALFSSLELGGDCDGTDELAVVGNVGSRKATSLGVSGVIWALVTSFVGPTMLGESCFGGFGVEIDGFSPFSLFWVKPAVVDRVSRAVVLVEGADKSEAAVDSVANERTVKSCEISLVPARVVPIFEFFPFSESAGDCDVAT